MNGTGPGAGGGRVNTPPTAREGSQLAMWEDIHALDRAASVIERRVGKNRPVTRLTARWLRQEARQLRTAAEESRL